MAVKKRPESKVVVQRANETFLDIRIVHTHEGYGKKRRVKSSEYGIFHLKHRVHTNGFPNPNSAIAFVVDNFNKYDKKAKKFNV